MKKKSKIDIEQKSPTSKIGGKKIKYISSKTKAIIYLYNFLIFISFYSFIIPAKINIDHKSYSYDIKLKIKGSGKQTVCLASLDIYYPYEVTELSPTSNTWANTCTINLDNILDTDIELILRFNKPIYGTGLFKGLTNITEVDLSDSCITSFASTFTNCTSLVKVNFTNLNTSLVKDAINLFNGCKSLKSVDLSKLDLSQVNDFRYMFDGCQSLEYIKFENYFEDIFGALGFEFDNNISSNLVICINKEKSQNLILSLINKTCTVFYCGDDWKIKQNNSCVKNYNEISGDIIEENIIESDQASHEEEDEKEYDNENESDTENQNENTDIIKLQDFFNSDISININNITNKTLEKDFIEDLIYLIKKGEFKDYIKEKNETELIKKTDSKTYQLSTLSSQLYNKEIASINLGICEDILRNSSNIAQNEDLTIFKISHIIPESKTQITEYEIFTLDGIQLNLSLCKDFKIKHEIPIELTESELYKFDPKSNFYNDICLQYTTESGTDMTNYERKKIFNDKNMGLCENDCEFKEYNKDKKRVICDCNVKNIFNSFAQVDKSKLLKKFSNYKNIFNLDVFKCNKLLFSKKGLLLNIANYITLCIIIINIINTIIFYFKGYDLFFKDINNKMKDDINSFNNNSKKDIFYTQRPLRITNHKRTFKKKNKKIISSPPNKRSNKKNKTMNNKNQKEVSISKDMYLSSQNIDSTPKINKEYNNRNDYEMNSLSYKEAKKYDKRNFYQYYLSLIRTNQLIIFTFYTKDDYNSRIIKICFFFTSFSLYYTIKALFFNDSVMHVIYLNKGVYDFIYQLPQIIYSAIISGIIKALLSYLSLTEDNVIKIRKIKETKNSRKFKDEYNIIKKRINIKLIIFFILNYFLLILFWYYLSCFSAVYKNTQVYLIKDVLISFGISLIYPFFISIFPCVFRLLSLKNKKGKYKNMYKFSKILQLI